VPEVLHGVEFRRIWRQRNQRYVVGDIQLPAGMEARLIPDHHDMHMIVDLLDQLIEENIDDVRIQVRADQAGGLAGLWTSSAQHIHPVVTRLFHDTRTGAFGSPDSCDRALLAKACLVLIPDLDAFARVLGFDRFDLFYNAFLKYSCACGSAFSCWGRGISHEKLSRCSSS